MTKTGEHIQGNKMRKLPLRGQCHQSKRNRQIEVNHTLDEYKSRVRELLTSEQELKHGSNRPVEPEAMFGQIKECGRFTRLRLRGLTGARIEFGQKALAHNFRKLALARDKTSFLNLFLSEKRQNPHRWDFISTYLETFPNFEPIAA